MITPKTHSSKTAGYRYHRNYVSPPCQRHPPHRNIFSMEPLPARIPHLTFSPQLAAVSSFFPVCFYSYSV